jgi:hypothetical protein
MDSNNRYCIYTDDIVIDGVCRSSNGGYTETSPYPPKMTRYQGTSHGISKSEADQIREINKKSEHDRNEIIKNMILIIILFIIILLYTIRKNPNNLIYSIFISFLYTGIIIAVLIGLSVLMIGVFMAVVMSNAR